MKKQIKNILKITIFFLLVLIIILAESHLRVDTTYQTIKSDKIPSEFDGTKIVLLTDYHNNSNIDEKILKIIEKESPKYIMMSGDMINEYEFEPFINFAKKLEKYETYYVFGNHEENMSHEATDEYYKKLEKTNLKIINNQKISLGNNMNLYGFSPEIKFYVRSLNEKMSYDYLYERIGEIDTSQYNILLSHDPLFYEFYSEYDFDMILSGHVHGGVINTPFGGLLSPDFTFFPEYYRGNNKIKNTNLIISRGLGYGNALKIRVFNNPEVVVVKLMKNN